PLRSIRRRGIYRGPDDSDTECQLDPQALRVPADDEGWDDRLVAAGRGAEKVDDRDLPIHRVAEPTIVGRVRIAAHERVLDHVVAGINLAMRVALVIVPDPSALAREHRSDRQQSGHPLRLEDAALRVH